MLLVLSAVIVGSAVNGIGVILFDAADYAAMSIWIINVDFHRCAYMPFVSYKLPLGHQTVTHSNTMKTFDTPLRHKQSGCLNFRQPDAILGACLIGKLFFQTLAPLLRFYR